MIARKNRPMKARRKRSRRLKTLLGTGLARYVAGKRLMSNVRPEVVQQTIDEERSIRAKEPIRCSFCGRGEDEAQKILAGPKVYICNFCARLCSEILDHETRVERPDEIRERVEQIRTKGKLPKVTLYDWFIDASARWRRISPTARQAIRTVLEYLEGVRSVRKKR